MASCALSHNLELYLEEGILMYKILIVEDEEIIRNVMPVIIDWNRIGFQVAAVAENGLEALKVLNNDNIDVVLTDIRMPGIDGLELACEIKTKLPHIKTILLSAYNDFEYARKGIEYGVYGYLLKSDDEEIMEEYFCNLKEALDKEKDSFELKEELSQNARDDLISSRKNLNNSYEQHLDNNNPHVRKVTEKAVKYIKNNYNSDISLEDVASYVNVHHVHLCRLLSNELGKTFKEILIETRIEVAKQLLSEIDMKVYEISEKVGYKKPRYFSEIFKKYTGVTPLEYREICSK
jgi:two-component system, response regulator YesN